MAFRYKKKSSVPRRFFLTILLLLVITVVIGGFFLFFEGEKPVASLKENGEFIGKKGIVKFTVSDNQSGIKSITLTAAQNDQTKTLYKTAFKRRSYKGQAGPTKESKAISFDAKKLGFKDGPVLLTLETSDFSFRGWLKGNTTSITRKIILDTQPPRIQILHSEKYIIPGGSGIAIYRLSDKEARHGVMLNGHFNPGFLIGDGRDDTFITFFGLPYDAKTIKTLAVTAVDRAGNRTVVPFSTIYKADRKKRDRINVTDGFLNKKIPEFEQFYPDLTGTFLEKYLYINNTVRKQNNQKISSLCNTPSAKRMWKDKFTRMPGSSRAGFADHRTYFYKGRPVDKQVHLGMDIASTRHANVRAANSGKIVYADYLGIYGNMVMIDHGQGVFSLYSHLSQINVAPGDKVTQKSVIGLTGTTGMAGGDHLHFSMLVNGIFVTPKEWWDQHWIEVTVDEPLIDSKF